MKFKVWSEESKNEKDDKQIFLRLGNSKNDDIFLFACDKHGKPIDCGMILIVDQDLRIILLADGLSNEIPLKSNSFGEPITETVHNMESRANFDKQKMISEILHDKLCPECNVSVDKKHQH